MEIIKQLFCGSLVSSSMGSLILVSLILSTTDLAFSSHKYAWLGTDQILIFFLDKMVVAKLFLFSQVTSYRIIYVYPLVSFIYCHIYIYIYNLIKSNFPPFFFYHLYGCDYIVNASESKQLHSTRFLHQQDFRFPCSQSCNCMIFI